MYDDPATSWGDYDFSGAYMDDGYGYDDLVGDPLFQVNVSPSDWTLPGLRRERGPAWYEEAPGVTDTKKLPDGVTYHADQGIYRWVHYTRDGKAVERLDIKPPTPRQLQRSRSNFNRSRGLFGTGIGASSRPLDVAQRDATDYIGETRTQALFGHGDRPMLPDGVAPVIEAKPKPINLVAPTQPRLTQSAQPQPAQPQASPVAPASPTPAPTPTVAPAPAPTPAAPRRTPTRIPTHRAGDPVGLLGSIMQNMTEPAPSTPSTPAAPAQPAQPQAPVTATGVRGSRTTAQGITRPEDSYEFNWRVMELDKAVPSHDAGTLAPRPDYPASLQPRDRARATSGAQVSNIAKNLSPSALLDDTHSLDLGAPIVGPDGVVESGSGRMMALQRAKAQHPDKYSEYAARLRDPATLQRIGIDPEDIKSIQNPVLVRERTTQLDDKGRVDFAREANAPRTMASSPTEKAMVHKDAFSDGELAGLDIPDTATTDAVLLSSANSPIANRYLSSYAPNELAALADSKGNLNKTGLTALRESLFARVYGNSPAGATLSQELQESVDEDMRRVGQALIMSLPYMARSEALVRAGSRKPEFGIADDIAVAVQTLRGLKRRGMPVDHYLRSYSMDDAQLSPTQKRLLAHIDSNSNSPRKLANFFRDYSLAVTEQPHKDQSGFFAEAKPKTKEDIIADKINLAKETDAIIKADMTFKPPPPPRKPPGQPPVEAAMGRQRRRGIA